MARLKIKDAPLLTTIVGDEKIPTGGKGDFSVTVDMLLSNFEGRLPFATKTELENVRQALDAKISNTKTTLELSISALDSRVTTSESNILGVQQDLTTHKADKANPHSVTKSQVGLGNVDNTSDANKPISTATQAALSQKASTQQLTDGLDLKFDKKEAQDNIYKNGAALPYNSTVTYNEGAVVNKDGKLKKITGGSWVDVFKNVLVYPSDFSDDIITASKFAAENGYILVTDNKTYTVTEEFKIPANTVWYSNNTTIKQGGVATETRKASVIAPESNVRIFGSLTLDMGTPTTGWGEKCHVRIDSFYNITPKVRGFFFDELVLKGGYSNCNGFVMAGGASLVRGKRIVCGDTSKIGRVFMAHWGNADQHYNDNGTYRHVASYSPTTHPHDCIIDEIVVGKYTTETEDWGGLVLISAGYDIDIKKISGSIVSNTTLKNKASLLITAGDLGFAYASTFEKTNKMNNISIGQITGVTHAFGISMVEQALYGGVFPDLKDDYTNVSIPPTKSDYLAGIHLVVDSVDLTGRPEIGVTTNITVNGSNGGGSVRINSIRSKLFYTVYSTRNENTNTVIDNIFCEDIKTNPIIINGTGSVKSTLPKNTFINNISCKRIGVTSSATSLRTVLKNADSVNTIIGSINLIESGNAYCIVDTSSTIGDNLTISEINVLDTSYAQTFLILNTNRATDPVCLNSFYSASSNLNNAISGGVSYKTNGRLREYVAANIQAVNMKIGDTYTVTSNPPQKFTCYNNGVANSANVMRVQQASTTFSQVEKSIAANTMVLLASQRSFGNAPINTAIKVSYSVSLLGLILNATMTSDNTFSVYAVNMTEFPIVLPAGNLTVSI